MSALARLQPLVLQENELRITPVDAEGFAKDRVLEIVSIIERLADVEVYSFRLMGRAMWVKGARGKRLFDTSRILDVASGVMRTATPARLPSQSTKSEPDFQGWIDLDEQFILFLEKHHASLSIV